MTWDEVERFVLGRVQMAAFGDRWGTVAAIVDALVLLAPLSSWAAGRPPSWIDDAEFEAIVVDTVRPRVSWHRCGDADRAEFFIEGVVVDRAEIDTSTIEWVVSNAHAEVQREMFARAGVDGDAVLVVSVHEPTGL